jgi:hypothetical protein
MTATYGSSTVKRRRRTNADLDLIDNAIVQAVEADHPVTLRGVYYRVVSAGAVDKTENGYRLVGRQLLKLRRAEVIPYSWITDGTRWITKPDSYDSLDELLEDAASSYRRALWHQQDVEVHIFTEKDAISGVVLPITSRWDVPLVVLRGYHSESFAYSVAQAIRAVARQGRHTYVYQLGDHDPSGQDAWRAFQTTVRGFLDQHAIGIATAMATFKRLAVTEQQIQEWQLPTRPTKQTDSRARNFSGDSVEVDAIPASQLRTLVEDAILAHVDHDALELTLRVEREEREVLTNFVRRRYSDGHGYPNPM